MRKVILILIHFFNLLLSYSQSEILIFDSYNTRYNYDWHGIDDRYTLDYKSDFINFAQQNGFLIDEFDFYNLNGQVGNVANNLYALDINNDNKLDIIYSGASGGESKTVKLFLKTENEFKLIHSLNQGIVKVKWDNDRISELYSHDWGCCAEFRLINTKYNVNYNEGTPTFKNVFQSIEYDGMTKPKEYFEKPIRFIIENEKYKIRFSPVIDDTTYFMADFSEKRLGNVIGFLSKGSTGSAFAAKKDETGRVWWYVLIDPEFEIKENMLYMEDLNNPTGVVGWISSRYVTKIQ